MKENLKTIIILFLVIILIIKFNNIHSTDENVNVQFEEFCNSIHSAEENAKIYISNNNSKEIIIQYTSSPTGIVHVSTPFYSIFQLYDDFLSQYETIHVCLIQSSMQNSSKYGQYRSEILFIESFECSSHNFNKVDSKTYNLQNPSNFDYDGLY